MLEGSENKGALELNHCACAFFGFDCQISERGLRRTWFWILTHSSKVVMRTKLSVCEIAWHSGHEGPWMRGLRGDTMKLDCPSWRKSFSLSPNTVKSMPNADPDSLQLSYKEITSYKGDDLTFESFSLSLRTLYLVETYLYVIYRTADYQRRRGIWEVT